jgi:hypothetical protein
MATFNETASGGILLSGSITIAFTAATCFSFDMIEILSGDPNILRRGVGYLRNSNSSAGLHGGFTNRQPAFIPNIVNCRQTSLRAKIANGNFPSE